MLSFENAYDEFAISMARIFVRKIFSTVGKFALESHPAQTENFQAKKYRLFVFSVTFVQSNRCSLFFSCIYFPIEKFSQENVLTRICTAVDLISPFYDTVNRIKAIDFFRAGINEAKIDWASKRSSKFHHPKTGKATEWNFIKA